MADNTTQPKKVLDVTFTGVFVFKRNHAIVTALVDDYAEKSPDHAMIFRRIDGQWKHRLIDNSVTGVCVVEEPAPKVLIMGIDGEIAVNTLPGNAVEQVDTSAQGPTRSCFLKRIRKIGDHVYVAGMARQVYRRTLPNQWTRIDAGTFVPRDQRAQSVGFADLHGLSEDAIYAVGYKGEMWFYNGKTWTQLDSPTNVFLSRVLCVSDDQFFACGMSGTILRGNRNGWAAIIQDTTKGDFWGMTCFQERIYLANYDGVFVLNGDNLSLVDMRLEKKLTTAYLDANDGVLWSVGQKDLAYTEDGLVWVELDKP